MDANCPITDQMLQKGKVLLKWVLCGIFCGVFYSCLLILLTPTNISCTALQGGEMKADTQTSLGHRVTRAATSQMRKTTPQRAGTLTTNPMKAE